MAYLKIAAVVCMGVTLGFFCHRIGTVSQDCEQNLAASWEYQANNLRPGSGYTGQQLLNQAERSNACATVTGVSLLIDKL